VKVRDDGTVKVLDFGLAKALSPEARGSTGATLSSPTMTSPAMTAMGIILGTAAYMSPEQAKGRPVDRRADIWAFGVVLYELLTGRRLFDAEDMSETLAAVLTRDVSLASLPLSIPPRLRALVADCLVRDPKQRLRDIGDARLVLDRLIAGESDSAPDPQPIPAAKAPMWRRALPWVAGAVATIGAATGAWMLKPEPARAVTRFSILLPEDQNFTNGGRQLVAVSPDGTKLVYVAKSRLYLREMSGLESRPIPGSDSGGAPPIGPAFSPDGQSVVFFSESATGPSDTDPTAPGSLKRLAIAGGTPVEICPATNPLGVSWDASGIVFGQIGKGILLVSPSRGEPKIIVAAGADEVLSKPRMLPGGGAVMFSAKKVSEFWDQGAIVVQPLPSGSRKTVVQGGADGQYLPTGHLAYAVSGVVLSVPFDLGTLAVTGAPVPIIEGVRRTGTTGPIGTGGAQFSYGSSTGTLAFLPGPVETGPAVVNDLAIFDRKGVARPLGLPPGSYLAPRVSPDGASVVFYTDDTREAIVWLYQLSGGTAMRRLTFGGRNQFPIWSSDGQWVAFQSDREGDRAIFRQRADGSGAAERLTKPEAGVDHVPNAFSRDGAFLLYSVVDSAINGRRGPLWTLSMKDRTATVFVTEHSNSLVEGVFSPDGHWVAYHARPGTTGPAQTYLQPFPPTGAKYLVGNGGHPYWSPKGDQLILNVGASASVIVPVTTTPAVTFGKPIDFSRTGRLERNPTAYRRNADSMPDGEHIIGVTSGPPTTTETPTAGREIIVVLNWFDDVRRKMR
jgi:serine/threonine-protein kinase